MSQGRSGHKVQGTRQVPQDLAEKRADSVMQSEVESYQKCLLCLNFKI